MEHIKGYLMIGLAGCFWGTLGLFGKILFNYSFSPELVVFCRLFIGFIIMTTFVLIKDKKLLKIDKRGLKYTALIGFFSQALFNMLYFQSIKATTIATAVVLLYTAPIFLIIMGRIFYKEALNGAKIFALILCIVGCFLTVTGGAVNSLEINLIGVLMGIGAGFNYSLVTILSKAILDDYDPMTIICYTFGFGCIFLIPFCNPLSILHINITLGCGVSLLALGLIPTALSYILYVNGLACKVEASKAGIISSLEIVVSVLISWIIFDEKLIGFKLLGIFLVLFSIVALQAKELLPMLNKIKVKITDSNLTR